MANDEQVERILASTVDWNRWRSANPRQVVDLTSADLNEARLAGADLSRAVLTGADLIGTDLRGADLNRAALIGTYLIGADLREAALILADLRGADLRGAQLGGTDLTGAFFLIRPQLEAANGNLCTKLPASLIRPEHWTLADPRGE